MSNMKLAKQCKNIELKKVETVDLASFQQRFGAIGVLGKL